MEPENLEAPKIQKITHLDKSIMEVRKEFDEKGSLSNNIVKALIEEVAILLNRYNDEHKRTMKADQECYHKNQEVIGIHNDCIQLKNEINTKSEVINTLTMEIKDTSFKHGELFGRVDAINEMSVGLATENKILMEQFAEAKVNCARFTTERDQLQNKVDGLDKDNDKILDAMKGMKDRVEKLSIQNVIFANENKVFKEASTEALSIKNKMLMERDQLKDKIVQGQQINAKFTIERDQFQSKVDDLNKDNNAVSISLKETKERVEKLSQQNVSLSNENKIFKESGTEVVSIKNKLLIERDQLNDKIVQGEQVNNELIKVQGQLVIKRDELGIERNELRDKIIKLEQDKEELGRENKDLKKEKTGEPEGAEE